MNARIGALAIVMAASLGTIPATPAFAADPNAPVVVTGSDQDIVVRRVSFADLDLTQASHQKMLNHRVGRAVSQVCDIAIGPGQTYYETTSCRSASWRGARPQIASAIARAQEMALYGKSNIQVAAISIHAGY